MSHNNISKSILYRHLIQTCSFRRICGSRVRVEMSSGRARERNGPRGGGGGGDRGGDRSRGGPRGGADFRGRYS